ncbi:MAG TPA: choice-of-anchor I family protein [Xenococcaceae cyanobacterium]
MISLTPIGTFNTGVEGAAEIPAYDAVSQRLFVVNAEAEVIDVYDLSNPSNLTPIFEIALTSGTPNSVAVYNGLVAVAVADNTQTERGSVAFFDADGNFISATEVGVLPDMLTFTPDGSKVLVANEGEPNDEYTIDPEGSISIIDVETKEVTTASFEGFNDQKQALIDRGVRIFGPGASVAQDLEPEYIAVAPDGNTAFVTLQENNAVAVVDIATSTVTEIIPLGFKDYSQEENALDPSNEDDGINIAAFDNLLGMYQPDAIASYQANGETYYITANEGDARDYDGFSEEVRVADLVLDPTAFPNGSELQQAENLGRLLTTTTLGDTDGDGDVEEIYSYGGRSFAIWNSNGELVFDSENEFATITADLVPELFNSQGDAESFDSRSDDKGTEPEGVVTGVVGDKTYAFIGLERIGGVMVYDVSNPTDPEFVQYVRSEGDVAPEGLAFIPGEESPSGKPLLTVAYEVSGSVTVFEIAESEPTESNFTLQLLHAADQEAGIPALETAPNFSAVLNALRDDYENTLVLSSGDAYIPGPFFAASETAFGAPGRGDILIQNELGFQAIAFGNHEFDFGTSTVADLISPDEEADYPGALFPYLSANLDFSTDENLAPLVTEDGQEASTIPNQIAGNTIVTVNDEPIGVVGATTPTLPSIASPGDVTVRPLEFNSTNPEDIAALAAEIQTSVDSLLAANPEINKVVLLAHMQQIAIEEQLAELLTNVDIIVAGGSNTLLADETDRLRPGDDAEGVYPILKTAADGNPIAVVNTDGNYQYVGRLVVDFDADGVIIPESIDAAVSGAYATDEEGVAAVDGTPDPEIVEITDQLETVIAEIEGNIFGNTEVYLNGTREDVRTQETNLGNLTADANLAIAQQTDASVVISLKNGGGIRDDIGELIVPPGATSPDDLIRVPPQANELAGKEAGDISQLDIENSLRFNNELTLLTLTAQELLDVIEHGVAATEEGATPGQFPQVSGVNFSFDADLPPGNRIESLAVVNENSEVIDAVVEDGELIGDAERTFRIVTLNFLANGGDDYPFPQGESANRVDLVTEDEENPNPENRTGEATFAPDGSEQDALAEFLAANFSETPFNREDTPPELDTRIQNLDFREDTIFETGSEPTEPTEPTEPEDPNFEPSFGTTETDIIEVVGSQQLIFAGMSNDLIDASAGEGNNRIYGGAGDDTLILGTADRAFGGAGDDRFFVTTGGDNTITGGAGKDQFWIATAELPEGINNITDFTAGEDVIGLAGLGIGFEAVSLTQQGDNALIGINGQDIAILQNSEIDNLSEADFAFG